MPVENLVAKAATTEAASLSNQGAVVTLHKDLLKTNKSENDTKSDSINSLDSTFETLEAGSDSKFRTDFLAAHLKNITKEGFEFTKVNKFENKEKFVDAGFEEIMEPQNNNDNVRLSIKTSKPQTNRNLYFKLEQIAMQFESSPQQKVAVQRYIQSYFAYLMSNDQKIKNRLTKDEENLLSKGLSQETLFSIQKQVRAALRADISLKIKENLLKHELSDSKIDSVMAKISTDSTINSAFFNKKIGGWNFDGPMADLQSTVNKAIEQNQQELSSFFLEDLENQLISKLITGDKNVSDLNKHLNSLMKLGIDVISWLDNIWPDKRFDHGLVEVKTLPKTEQGLVVNLNTEQQGSNADRDSKQYQMSESEIMINQLRALYVQRLIVGGWFSGMQISFKIRKLKNGLLKMGAFSDDLDEKISFEAETIAKQKIMEMIEEAMIERAGLFKLKGRAFDANKKKLEQLLKAAERIGMRVDEQDLKLLMEKINLRMLKIVEAQIEITQKIIAKKGNSKKLQKNLNNLNILKERLNKELNSKDSDLNFNYLFDEGEHYNENSEIELNQRGGVSYV